MTEKLFYQDPYCRVFSAEVQSCESGKKGWEILLDRTAFYPEGGGQPCDKGTLGGVPVLDVRDRGDEVLHICAAPLEVGSTVEGQIDWDHRFDLMQQHSGEHLVSGLVHAKYGYDNVGFHMGADMITIDFNGMIDEAGLREIEQQANDAIYRDIETVILYPTREELSSIDYRSKKELTGQVRLVQYPGVDLCACCGTHIARTGEIGLIRLFSCVKFRDGVRIEMLSGRRCLDYLTRIQEQNHLVSTQLSAKPMETGAAVQRLSEELASLKFQLAEAEDTLFRQKADQLQGQGDVLLFEDAMRPESVRKLCDRILSVCGGRCAVFAGSDAAGWKYAIGDNTQDLRPLCKELNAALQGRGGGKPNFVQGSAAASRSEIEAFFAR